MDKNICAVCGKEYGLYGNSTWGLWKLDDDYQDDNDCRGETYRCCDECNARFVVPARMGLISRIDIKTAKI